MIDKPLGAVFSGDCVVRPDVIERVKVELYAEQGAKFLRCQKRLRAEPSVVAGVAKLDADSAVVWVMPQAAQCLRRVGFRADMVGHLPAGDALQRLAGNAHYKMGGRERGRGVVKGLALEGFKIIPVLFRGASGVRYPMDDYRFYAVQFFSGPRKEVDSQ